MIFHSTIATEKGDFTIDDVAAGITQKLVLRHPHVFGDAKLERCRGRPRQLGPAQGRRAKSVGKKGKNQRESILDEVPIHFPGLLEGLKLTTKAAKVGFDWRNTDEIFEKLDEEVPSCGPALMAVIKARSKRKSAICSLSSLISPDGIDVEPETAIKRTNRKFRPSI